MYCANNARIGGVGGGSNKGAITEKQNFLKNAPLQILNLKPDKDGLIIYKNDRLRNYAQLVVVVVDEGSVVQHTCSLNEESAIPVPKRNLTGIFSRNTIWIKS